MTGDPAAIGAVDRVVRDSVLGHGIVRVKIWTAQGRIVYSDARPLIGTTDPLRLGELAALRSGAVVAEPHTNTTRPENRFERPLGELLEVYLPIRTPSGRPLLFEGYLPSHEVSASARHLWLSFAPALFGGLLLLELVLVPLAWSLARRLRRREQERAELLAHAVKASEEERRRIAGDLHDGVVQDLAGIAYSLDSAAELATSQPGAALVVPMRTAAGRTRQSIRALRSLLVDIYPPSLRSEGLEAALSDLLASLAVRGTETQLHYPLGLVLDDDAEALLYRAAQEAVRNVAAHSQAREVEVSIQVQGQTVSLTVRDDGVGFSAEQAEQRRQAGHLGLGLLEDLVHRRGGQLEISSEPGQGTSVRVEIERA